MIFAIYLHMFFLLRLIFRYRRQIGTLIGAILWQIFLLTALTLARTITLIPYILIFGMPMVVDFFIDLFSKPSDINDAEELTPRPKDIPEGWVKVRRIRTDEISEFDLNFQASGGEWENRDVSESTIAEIRASVERWQELVREHKRMTAATAMTATTSWQHE